ncbi:hypothetical protein [Thermococcus sp.]|uniref:hypothetical protein n=1 Tax=Thermococcus sp. TaxID=35749 RepID=UPI0025EF0963|nr:hypothetical protein [Thermococcus sp.]
MVINLENEHITVRETYKSSHGGDYTYIVMEPKLIHISKLFRPSKKEYEEIMYNISTKEAEKILGEQIELVEFSFSNRGYFYPKKTSKRKLSVKIFPKTEKLLGGTNLKSLEARIILSTNTRGRFRRS